MTLSKIRIKMFSTISTSKLEKEVNDWINENPETAIHKIDFQVDKAVHAMVIYEPAGEVK